MNDLTIIVPTMAHPECLQNFLASLPGSYPTTPVLVGDSSKEPYALHMARGHLNVRAFRLDFFCGVSAARNFLLDRVTTRLLCLCDHDLVLEPGVIERLREALLTHDLDIAGGGFDNRASDQTANRFGTEFHSWDCTLDHDGDYFFVRQTLERPSAVTRVDCVTNFWVGRTEAVRRVRWNERLKMQEHDEFFWRAKKAGLRVGYVPDVWVQHRRIPNPEYDALRHSADYFEVKRQELGIRKRMVHRLRRHLGERRILGIGLANTGTESLASALVRLGYRTIHGVSDAQTEQDSIDGVIDSAQMRNYDAIVHTPLPVLHYREYEQAYPNALFILTIRDRDAWLALMRRDFDRASSSSLESPAARFYQDVVFGTRGWKPEYLWRKYQEHVRSVGEYFEERRGKLLVMQVDAGNGWQVLCPFLGHPIPDEDFPVVS